MFSRNKTRGVQDLPNMQSVWDALRKKGVDPYAIGRGGPLNNDFSNGIRSVARRR
jgi:hypothetical protein